MGILSKLLGEKQNIIQKPKPAEMNNECKKLIGISNQIGEWTSKNHFVARSEYLKELDSFKEITEFFAVLEKSKMLGSFCAQNGIKVEFVKDSLKRIANITSLVDKANDEYIEREMKLEKNYLDNILHEVDPHILLDEDQRKVVLADEDYCLVVAGAGAGKTTTVAAKVKYLVEKKNIKPEQILVISFTNKAVQEYEVLVPKKQKIVLDPEDKYYGYLKLNAMFGMKEVNE